MTLTPEQFNKLVTKDEFNKLAGEVGEIKSDVKKILTAVDGIAKKHKDFEQELAANIGAHDRFQADITKLKVHTGLQV